MKIPSIPRSTQKGAIMIIPYFGRFAGALCNDPEFQEEVLEVLSSYDAGSSFVILQGLVLIKFRINEFQRRDAALRQILIAGQRDPWLKGPNWTSKNIVSCMHVSKDGSGILSGIRGVGNAINTIRISHFDSLPFDIDMFTAVGKAKIWRQQLEMFSFTYSLGFPLLTTILEETPGRTFSKWERARDSVYKLFGYESPEPQN